jgi:hypothetical protein
MITATLIPLESGETGLQRFNLIADTPESFVLANRIATGHTPSSGLWDHTAHDKVPRITPNKDQDNDSHKDTYDGHEHD